MAKSKIKVIVRTDNSLDPPLEVKWGDVVGNMQFLPTLVKTEDGLLTILGSMYDVEENTLELFTKQTHVSMPINDLDIN